MMQKMMEISTSNEISGFILTIFFSLISIQDIDAISKIIATGGTAISAISTAVYFFYKTKKLKNEQDSKKH